MEEKGKYLHHKSVLLEKITSRSVFHVHFKELLYISIMQSIQEKKINQDAISCLSEMVKFIMMKLLKQFNQKAMFDECNVTELDELYQHTFLYCTGYYHFYNGRRNSTECYSYFVEMITQELLLQSLKQFNDNRSK